MHTLGYDHSKTVLFVLFVFNVILHNDNVSNRIGNTNFRGYLGFDLFFKKILIY